jgi:ceramide glucosyltransferase
MQWHWDEILTLTILGLFVSRTLIAHFRLRRHLRGREEPSRPDAEPPPISIIMPVRGLDQEAEANFLSFAQASYPAPFEVFFALEERDDPAVPLLQRLIAEGKFTGPARLVFSRRQDQREIGKTVNLIAGVKESSHDILVFSDSDVRNTPGFLEELIGPLADPRVGMSYACPSYRGAKDWVAALIGLSVNESILALMTAPTFSAISSAMAIRKDVLHAIGGLMPLRHRIGIDGALGRAVVAKGYRIALIRTPAMIIHPQGRLIDWWRQIHRWLVTIRLYLGFRFLGFLFYGFPILWASLYSALTLLRGEAAAAIAVMTLIFVVRLASFAVVNLVFVKDPAAWRYVWLLPLLEVLTLALWLESCFNPLVVWRGKKYRVMSDATVRPVR